MFLLKYVFAIPSCPAPMDGLVLNHYALKNCPACKNIQPVMDEIVDRISEKGLNLKYRKVDCNSCECDSITTFPHIEVTKNHKKVSNFVGYKPYTQVADWLSNAISIPKNILTDLHLEHRTNQVKELNESDFDKSFDGKWMILFYNNKTDTARSTFKELAQHYPEISVAEATSSVGETILNRFNITSFPAIVAYNHGVIVPYIYDTSNIMKLDEFASTLIAPVFENISGMDELKRLTSDFQNGESVFVVLHNNYEIASHYFERFANDFKFKAKIYRTDSPKIFNEAGFFPHQKSSDHSDIAKLFLYKNGTFYPSPFTVDQKEETIHWIFHTHFPHVSDITPDNFYSIFHGLRPVLILSTNGEHLIEEYNQAVNERHFGLPVSDVLHATLDNIEYPEFHKKVLSKTPIPSLTMYDPVNSKWYYKKLKLTRENIKDAVAGVVKDYVDDKLPEYPPRGFRLNYTVLFISIFIGLIYLAISRYSREKKME